MFTSYTMSLDIVLWYNECGTPKDSVVRQLTGNSFRRVPFCLPVLNVLRVMCMLWVTVAPNNRPPPLVHKVRNLARACSVRLAPKLRQYPLTGCKFEGALDLFLFVGTIARGKANLQHSTRQHDTMSTIERHLAIFVRHKDPLPQPAVLWTSTR